VGPDSQAAEGGVDAIIEEQEEQKRRGARAVGASEFGRQHVPSTGLQGELHD